jgi:hypothetical protein
MKPAIALLIALGLTGCGAANRLQPAKGESLPVAPRGATATPTPQQLLTATPQERPQRSDELMTQSQDRRSDEFDLPPR